MINWKEEKEKLCKMIFDDNLAYEEIGREYGVTCQAIRKAAKKLGIVLPQRRKINETETFNKGKRKAQICLNCGKEFHSKHIQKYCSNKCQQEHRSNERYKNYLENQNNFVGREITYQWLKKKIIEEQNHKCDICGLKDEWNGKDLHFVLDHIDGDATNNVRKNLRLICPNCDSQLDTYKSRNIGKSTRKYKPYRLK